MFDLARKYGARSLALASVAAVVALTTAPADAAGYASHGGGGYHGGGNYHGGGYRGGYHGGGWGWGVGLGLGLGLGAAYYDPWWPGYYGYGGYPYYASPSVTVVQPQAAPVQAAPAAPASYYYCDNPGGYYPYVQNCSQPWRQVPAIPQGAPPQ